MMIGSGELWRKIKGILTPVETDVTAIDDITADLSAGTIVSDVISGVPKIITPASSGSANTFGSWAEYDASTSAISYICTLTIGCPARGKSIDVQIDIGVTESAVVSIPFNYFYKSDIGYLPTVVIPIFPPIKVAASAVISIRVTDNEANANTYRVGLGYYQK